MLCIPKGRVWVWMSELKCGNINIRGERIDDIEYIYKIDKIDYLEMKVVYSQANIYKIINDFNRN